MNTTNPEMPQEYIYGLVQGQEDNFSIPQLTAFQGQMLGEILKTGDIIPFPVEESQRLQDIKIERLGFFDIGKHSSIPLRNMGNQGEVESIIGKLEELGATSSLFERYTQEKYDPRELRLDQQFFRRLGLDAYKNQLLGVLRGEITASIPLEILEEITRNKLKTLGCTDRYLNNFIQNNI